MKCPDCGSDKSDKDHLNLLVVCSRCGLVLDD
ncbi:MAG: hypothetical protein HZB68_03680 [Candidatus Aenigmarchaeota archaeon]|nr:hypothetical protein [Candidatus Aenigmarchaeota archaeon]